MENDEVMLQCPNDLCKEANSETDKYCKQCGTSLIKRYLWAVGDLIETCQIGELVAGRYLQTSHRIFLDTKPGLLPQTPELDDLNEIKPYLRLVSYRLQIPSVYGLVSPRNSIDTSILLLEQAPIYTDPAPHSGQLMPELLSAWKEASALRQLNWLLQIAQLWQPMRSEGVASSLLVPELIRVDRSLVRLLELRSDQDNEPTLPQLGQFWSQLAIQARPSIADFIAQLAHALQQEELISPEQLVASLDRGLSEVGKYAVPQITISTCTDTGPSRQRNEDACYPASGSIISKPPQPKAVAIVCDGIGGHEGGNVASNLAIETVCEQIEQLPLDDKDLDSENLSTALESFVCAANDRISLRNDKENRQGRQRMGTTLVMAVGHRHSIYIAHVGDSRAYLITRTGCYQVTLDDDVAAREVRLGYAVYRDALQQPSAGSLVQAIGMSASVHPTIGRFVIDEDCVFLLCSDGLSDFDLVDQCWEDILPILDGIDIATVTQQLVEIGNTRNGHDNITVALVHCQVNAPEPETPLSYLATHETPSMQVLESLASGDLTVGAATVLQSKQVANFYHDDSIQDTQLLTQTHKPRSFVKMFALVSLLGLLISIGGGLLLVYLANLGILPDWLGLDFDSSAQRLTPDTSTQTQTIVPLRFVAKEHIIDLNLAPPPNSKAIASPNTHSSTGIKDILPKGSVVEVLDRTPRTQQDKWLIKVVNVCPISDDDLKNLTTRSNNYPKAGSTKQSPPTANSSGGSGQQLLQEGDSGWIQAANINKHFAGITADQMERCPDMSNQKGD